MNPNWFLYALLIGGLMTVAAWQVSRATGAARGSMRWAWMLASGFTVVLPLLALIPRQPAEDRLEPVGPPRLLESAFINPASRPLSPNLWLGVSLLALGWVMVSYSALSRQRQSWKRMQLLGIPVAVSKNFGPAVVGVLRPEIVLPEWSVQLPPDQLSLILAHEQEHLRQQDSRLLGLMLLLLIAMPWQIFLWLQLKGLRLAIELDCDSRVVRNGAEPQRYGELLLHLSEIVSARSVNAWSIPFTPFSMRLSSLEQRIRALSGSRPTRVIATLGLMVTGAMLVLAFALTPPPVTVAPSQAGSVSASAQREAVRQEIVKAFPRRSSTFYREATSMSFMLGVRPLTGFRKSPPVLYRDEEC